MWLNYCRLLFFIFIVSCQSNKREVKSPLPSGNGPPIEKTKLKSMRDIKPKNSLVSGPIRKPYTEQNSNPNLEIVESDLNKTGSLFEPSSKTSNFLLDNLPVGVGSSISLVVDEVRSAESTENQSEEIKEKDADELTKELLDGLPNLMPEDGSNKKALTKISAKVVDRLKNGDLIVEAHRSSSAQGETRELFFRATVPSDKIKNSRFAAISDLTNVIFQERGRGVDSLKKSSGWEDEYTLRYSGFVEVPSKLAQKIDADRQSLISMRKRLQNKVNSFKSERDKIARERSDMYSEKTEFKKKLETIDEEIKGYKTSIAERDETIKDLQDKIKELEEEKVEPVAEGENINQEEEN